MVDLVVALHVRRLIGEGPAFDEADALVEPLCAEAGVDRDAAEAADRVTNVCDVVSFHFCFEEPAEREARGFRLRLDGHGLVEVDPWPFAVPRLVGLVTAFQLPGYPERLVPVVVPYDVRPM